MSDEDNEILCVIHEAPVDVDTGICWSCVADAEWDENQD